MLAGVVPIYLGDSSYCKMLIPFPNAVIYLDDYGGDIDNLIKVLKRLSTNETAYEEHRSAWRLIYPSPTTLTTSSLSSLPKYNHLSHALEARQADVTKLVIKSWPCRMCEWTMSNVIDTHTHTHKKRPC